jgi:dTDP-4-amino-4,6-dideoxygalactose transaminase
MKGNLAINGGAKVVPEELKVNWPVITKEDKNAVMRVLDRGVLWAITGPDGNVLAPEMHALEAEFASYIGVKHCLAVNGGTSAIHMALAAAGVGPGDEVITSAFSFVATPVAILHQNAIPIFVDIHPATFNIDVAKIEEKITERTKAIIPVHIHGVPADVDELMALAKRYNLVVIEDACQAPGAVYKNKKAGNLGHMAAFSLNGTKNLAVGEGGLFVTNDQTYRDKANVIRQVGEDLPPEDGSHRYQHLVAWNYRAQEMPCAFARSQLKRLDEINATGRRNGEYLTKHLADIKGIITPYIPEDRTSTYHKYRIRLAPEDLGLEIEPIRFREALRIALQAEGVDVVLWQTETLPEYPIFQSMEGYGKGCPWTCAQSNKQVTYSYKKEDYPETTKLVESSFVVGSELHPLYCQKRDLMAYYVEAFHKVFDKIDQVVEMAEQLDDQKVAYSSKS